MQLGKLGKLAMQLGKLSKSLQMRLNHLAPNFSVLKKIHVVTYKKHLEHIQISSL